MQDQNDSILLIDDDSRNIFALTAVLKAKGFQVISSSSAPDGINLLRKNKGIKVVLLDMMMPGMDGYEALSEIKGDEAIKDVPVFAVTAQAMVGDRERCLQAGADEYVSKPIDMDLLMNLLRAYKVEKKHEG